MINRRENIDEKREKNNTVGTINARRVEEEKSEMLKDLNIKVCEYIDDV